MTTPQIGFAALNGTKFYYEMAGAGAPLVLVHAGICDSRMWDDQFTVFAQRYQVVRYDLRGYGQTAPVEGVYAHHTDLCALLDYVNIRQAHLLGCSMGGATIIDFALTYPERVASLIPVCCEPSGFQDPVEEPLPADWNEIVAAFKAGELERVSAFEVRLWVDGPARTPTQVAAAIRDKVHGMNLIALSNEAKGLGQRQPFDPLAAERLNTLHAPTLLVVGDLDQGSMVRAAEYMATQIPNVQKQIISGTAHLPNMEQPTRFNELVLNFLSAQSLLDS